MNPVELRFRQVHLDFHTSPCIEGVGQDFDPEEFAATLERARVDSINIFARCHHGHIYYDTRRFPERRHPHLRRNLLAEQIEACHRRDIRTPIYITVQWDQFTAEEHPEWLVITAEGKQSGTPPYQPGFYRALCLNTPYVDWLKSFVAEVAEMLPTDGFWFDIVWPQDCSCRFCREDMAAQGIDASDAASRMKFGTQVYYDFCHDMTAYVRKLSSDAQIFYNRGHISPAMRPAIPAYTQLELESLPSGGWGYLHFPMTMRYARTLGLDCLGMTGKFHRSWGDFHSFKNRAALEFECFQMLALGGKCCVGDQLHPSGKICQTTYDLIGSVYAQVEKKEPWCRGAVPLRDIGVLTPEEFAGTTGHTALPKSAMGATRMLQEGKHQFDIIDTKADFGQYRLLVLPDEIPVGRELAAKIETYVKRGGSLIATHKSGLAPDGSAFALPALGVRRKGEAPFSPDFIVPDGAVGKGLPKTGHVLYLQALEVEPAAGAEVLAQVEVPYFNRTWQHFCSHAHTPSSGRIGYPGIVRNGRCIYFAHPIFTQYQQNTPRWVKILFLNAVDMLLPDPLVRVGWPSSLIATLNEQPVEKRLVLHLLHYVPERRSDSIDVIEDVIPVHNIDCRVRVGRAVRRVVCEPEGEAIAFTADGGAVHFTVPEVAGHQIVAIELG